MRSLHHSTLPQEDLVSVTQNTPIETIHNSRYQPATQNQHALNALDWSLLPLLMIVTPLIYLFRTQYNLPMAANVDERTALGLFVRFHTAGMNPHFFMYPTLYYYLSYFFVHLFPPSELLVWGRILNLSFVGLTSFIAYSFCRLYFLSRAAGLLSAIFIITSPTILNSGSYICTDALLAAFTLASLLLLMQYFQQPTLRNWIIAMIGLGLAAGCKYTALLLFIAYAATEMIYELHSDDRDGGRGSESRISRTFLSGAFAVLGALFLAVAWAFPLSDLLQFASTHHTNPDLRSSADYLTFFHHVRMILIFGGAVLLTTALLIFRSAYLYRLLALKRLYAGLPIVLLVLVLTTPYSILDPAKFIYDLGAQARGTVMIQNAHAQWRNYYSWLGNESKTLLLLGLLGFATLMLRSYRRYLIVIVFATLYVFTIGSAHIGFPRYLTPLLPLIYVLAAGFLIQTWTAQKSASLAYTKILTTMLLVVATAELFPKFESSRALSKQKDAFWSSYHLAMDVHAAKVIYAGLAPSAELSAAGVPVFQTSWASLGSMPLGNQLDCGELLMFDRRAAEAHHLTPETDTSVTILLDDRSGDYGQEVLRRADCK
jgi:4-amino-4-deoxy-L-arabinose transferase-like glycosyltransferase